MKPIYIATLIGITAGIIDVIPMIIQKLNRTACLSAFIHYFVLGLIIPFIAWEIAPWAKGTIVSLLTSIPIMVIVYPEDKKALIPMSIFSILLGAGIGITGAAFI